MTIESKACARYLFECLRMAEDRPTVWLWCDTPRLREGDAVGWKVVTYIGWLTAESEPPAVDSEGSRVFGFDGGSMGVGPDELVEYVWVDE